MSGVAAFLKQQRIMQLNMISALFALSVTLVNGQVYYNDPVDNRAYNYPQARPVNGYTEQEAVMASHKNQAQMVGMSHGAKSKDGKAVRKATGRCVASNMTANEMPVSYNDKSSGFFVDMGMIFTDYYGVTSSVSKLDMHSIARTFTAPVSSYAKAQDHQDTQTLYDSIIGLLNVLIDHTVNDTYVSPSDWSNYNINHRVFSPMQVNDLLRKRGRLLSLAQQRDNGSDEVVRKEVAVRKMQLKIFEAKGPESINTIIAGSVNYRQYRKRFAEYMYNICAQTQDRDTIRQVRNHFAFWLSQGYEDQASKDELDSTYEDSSSSSFFYPEGFKFSLASGLYTLLGAIAIGLFMTA